MEALDGNAIGGALLEHFGAEMTAATGTCASCGTRAQIGELEVYLRAPGAVVRCRTCHNVVFVVVEIRGTTTVNLERFELAAPHTT